MTIDLHAGDLIKVRGYQQSPSGGLIPVYSICEVVAIAKCVEAVECDREVRRGDSLSGRLRQRVRVVHHYPSNPAGWELPYFTVSLA